MEGSKAREKGTTPEDPAFFDLSGHLAAWEYDDSATVRRVELPAGRQVLQVRLPLGFEQYELEGRPDGKRPMGQESWLHYYARKAKTLVDQQGDRFLGVADFVRLQHEGLLYYYRYLLFFQIQEYRLCARDTRRNLRLVDFVERHAPRKHANQLAQYRPYILRMYVMSRALSHIQTSGAVRFALRLLKDGKREIDSLESIPGNQVFEWEKTRALVSLDDLISQLEIQIPLPKKEHLRRQLEAAIHEENYERAAAIRDEIARLGRKVRRSEGPAS